MVDLELPELGASEPDLQEEVRLLTPSVLHITQVEEHGDRVLVTATFVFGAEVLNALREYERQLKELPGITQVNFGPIHPVKGRSRLREFTVEIGVTHLRPPRQVEEKLGYNQASKDAVLLHAVEGGQTQQVVALLRAGADPNVRKGADQVPRVKSMEQAKQRGAEALSAWIFRDVYALGPTPLMLAAREGREDLVRALLDGGAGVNLADADGDTALDLAASRGNAEIVRRLISAGADVKSKRRFDEPVLAKAAVPYKLTPGHVEVVKLLVAAGSDPNAQTRHGVSVLSAVVNLSVTYEHPESSIDVAKTLIEAKADMESRHSKFGRTPLIEAAETGLFEVVKSLVEAGADVETAGLDSLTALQIAQRALTERSIYIQSDWFMWRGYPAWAQHAKIVEYLRSATNRKQRSSRPDSSGA